MSEIISPSVGPTQLLAGTRQEIGTWILFFFFLFSLHSFSDSSVKNVVQQLFILELAATCRTGMVKNVDR